MILSHFSVVKFTKVVTIFGTAKYQVKHVFQSLRSHLLEVLRKNAALKNISKVTVKHLPRSPICNKASGLSLPFYYKGINCKCFPLNFAKFSERLFYRTDRQLHFLKLKLKALH